MEVSMMIHVAVVLLLHWILSYFYQCRHPLLYFLSFIYLYLVHDRYVMRLKRYLHFCETKQSTQKRVLTDSETVRWLNHAVEKIWPICLEQIVSQKILLPIIPWFLEKYKPWTAKEAMIQHLYMGRNPPLFTEMRVLHESAGDDHLVLELGMNFLTADDMSAILAIKLRKRLGFGMWVKLHLTGMHVEGKVLVGVKFLRKWPFLGRIRVCFVEPPYFQMTVKPLFSHGVDVTVLPGIAEWLDKLLSIAFEQTLVEPNMLVVDMEKFVSPEQESWFRVDEREVVAFAKIEFIEGSDMKPSDLNGLADPYVKAHLGPYKIKTQIQKKTLAPKWLEEFKIPVSTWESPNLLVIQVYDKDHFVSDSLGDCIININNLRGGQRHDMWLPLENINMGRLHLAITVLEDKPDSVQEDDKICDGETPNEVDKQNSSSDENTHKGSVSSETSTKVLDKFQPINIEGQQETGIWVHQPGSEVAQIWEPRKGKSRRLDTEILSVPNDSFNSASSLASGVLNNDSSSNDGSHDGKRAINSVRRGIRRISAVFNKGSKKEDPFNFEGNPAAYVRSPYANIRAENTKDIGVKLVVEETLPGQSLVKPKEGSSSAEGSSPDSHNSKGHMKDMAKSIFKQAEKGARSLKHVLSRKDSKRCPADPSTVTEREIHADYASSDDESSSLLSPGVEKTSVTNPISSCIGGTQNINNQVLEKVNIGKVSSP